MTGFLFVEQMIYLLIDLLDLTERCQVGLWIQDLVRRDSDCKRNA